MTTFVTKSIVVNGTEYKVTCPKDEEGRVEYLAGRLDRRVRTIATTLNSKLNDTTLLLFTALELENLLLDSINQQPFSAEDTPQHQEKVINYIAAAIENFIEHVENMD